jgi:membrane protein
MLALSVALPRAARELLIEQMLEIARGSSTGLGIGLIVSVAFTLLSAAGGIEALISGVNVAYDERETRSFVRLRLIALKFTLAFILFVIVALGTIAVLPPLLDALGIGEVTSAIARGLRWPALALLMMLSLSVLYRHSPNRTPPKWRWVSSGAVLATAIWIIVSVALSAYVSRVGSFNETYGTLGGVMALLLWFYLTSLAILLGAELNAELEHQTALDSTVGPPKPLGERGAFVADTIGEARTP